MELVESSTTDDFLVVGSAHSTQCAGFLSTMLQVCDDLGIPLASDKIEGPTLSSSLSFLGIRLASVTMEARLPEDKLARLCSELEVWQVKKSCTRKELQHLIGVLQFAGRVVPQGRPFVCRLINLLCVGSKPYHHIRLSKESRSDILWWLHFAQVSNGLSLSSLSHLATPSANIFSDASGSWGCGAVWGTWWFQGQWPQVWSGLNIMIKELVPVVVAAAMWSHHWSCQHVHFHIDNMAVVEVLANGSSKEPSGVVMHRLRCLSFFSAFHQFSFSAIHIPGVRNSLVDDISRNHVSSLASQVPMINPSPTLIPPALWP